MSHLLSFACCPNTPTTPRGHPMGKSSSPFPLQCCVRRRAQHIFPPEDSHSRHSPPVANGPHEKGVIGCSGGHLGSKENGTTKVRYAAAVLQRSSIHAEDSSTSPFREVSPSHAVPSMRGCVCVRDPLWFCLRCAVLVCGGVLAGVEGGKVGPKRRVHGFWIFPEVQCNSSGPPQPLLFPVLPFLKQLFCLYVDIPCQRLTEAPKAIAFLEI